MLQQCSSGVTKQSRGRGLSVSGVGFTQQRTIRKQVTNNNINTIIVIAAFCLLTARTRNDK